MISTKEQSELILNKYKSSTAIDFQEELLLNISTKQKIRSLHVSLITCIYNLNSYLN